MLNLGDVVRAIDAKPETSQSESTIKRITEMNGLYYYRVSGYTKAFTEDKLWCRHHQVQVIRIRWSILYRTRTCSHR